MRKTLITFEIHDITTKETLVENAHFDDIPELLVAYQSFYPTHQIVVCYRQVTMTEQVRVIPKHQFKSEWFEMLDCIIDNLYS